MRRQCLLIASATTDLSALIAHLGKRNVVAVGIDYDYSIGGSIVDSLLHRLQSIDLAIAVVSRHISANVFFEIGLVVAKQVPLCLIVEPLAEVPSDLLGLHYVRGSLDNLEALKPLIDQVLTLVDTRTKRRPVPQKKTKKFPERRQQLEKIKSLPSSSNRARLFEEWLQSLFLEAEIQSTQAKGVVGTQPDFAIWIDELEKVLGNPVLVEAKATSPTSKAIEEARIQLSGYLERSSTRCGVIVFLNDLGIHTRTYSSRPPILVIDAENLLSLVEEGQFARAIIQERNRIVHGVP